MELPVDRRCRQSVRLILTIATAAAIGAAPTAAPRQQQQPTFKAGVTLVAVDVQAVDERGAPVADLRPADFKVSIGGHDRRVVSADYVKQGSGPVANVDLATAGPAAANQMPTTRPGRVYIVAVDVESFTIVGSRNAAAAARGFIDRLDPEDVVGLDVYPLGPIINPTLDHRAVEHGLDAVTGQRHASDSHYHLTSSDVVDITADPAGIEPADLETPSAASSSGSGARSSATGGNVVDVGQSATIRQIQQRESCPAPRCVVGIVQEAESMSYDFESHLMKSVDGLHRLFQSLAASPVRKIVVLMSAGVVATDRPGGRPDGSAQARELSQEVAQARSAVYTLDIDSSMAEASTADASRDSSPRGNQGRDDDIGRRWLEEFSGSSGGTLLQVLAGSGESSLDRVLKETSAYYLLGVEPASSDEDGHTRELRVKIGRSGVTLRSRAWVQLPKKPA